MTYIFHRDSKGVPKELSQDIATGSAASVYSPPANTEVEITQIVVSNTSNAGRWFSIWIDQDGTTYDNSTKLFHQVNVSGNSTLVIDGPFYMDDSNGNIAIRAQNATDITITIFGIEYDIS